MALGGQPGGGQIETTDHLEELEKLFDFYFFDSGKEQAEAALDKALREAGTSLEDIRKMLMPDSLVTLRVKEDLLGVIKMWNHAYKTELTSKNEDVRETQTTIKSAFIDSIRRITG